MTRSFIALSATLAGALLLGACSRSAEETPPPAPAPTAVPAPAATADPAPAVEPPMSAELAARLIRPHSPVLGPANAPVTVVEFLDPACGACAGFAPFMKQLQLLHGDDVRVVFRYATFHRGSEDGVRILEAARRQGKFEATLAALFDGQAEWADQRAPNIEKAWELARAAGVDIARARRDAAEADGMLRIEAMDVSALKVDRTPTVFVNARPLSDFGVEQMFALVQYELARAGKTSRPPHG